MAASLQELLTAMVERGASDLHLSCGTYPRIRLNGSLELLEEFETLTPADTERLICSVLTDAQRRHFDAGNDLDLSFGVEGLARFRCNVYRQRGAICAAMRMVPYKVRSLEELQLPPVVKELADKHKGLVLVTGPTGSGKSTTLTAMIDRINSERKAHIVTIEDPIEFVHQHKKSLVHQREILADSQSFRDALTADGHGRVMAMEIMVPTPAIRNLIRQEKVHEIYSMIQSGGRVGMQTMSQSLANLVRAGKLTKAEALARAPLPEEFAALLGSSGNGVPTTGNHYGTGLADGRR
jgi:Tfp pilus assembly pilus retraction ATPase PilT